MSYCAAGVAFSPATSICRLMHLPAWVPAESSSLSDFNVAEIFQHLGFIATAFGEKQRKRPESHNCCNCSIDSPRRRREAADRVWSAQASRQIGEPK